MARKKKEVVPEDNDPEKMGYWFNVTEPVLVKIQEFGRLGVKIPYVINFFMVNRKTWARQVKKHPEILERYYKGRSEGIEDVTTKLKQLIEKGNVTATIFWLKCNAGMIEASKDTPAGDDKPEEPIPKLKTPDPIEAARVYQNVMMKD